MDSECLICHEMISDKGEVHCGQLMHTICIQQWGSKCPVCKKILYSLKNNNICPGGIFGFLPPFKNKLYGYWNAQLPIYILTLGVLQNGIVQSIESVYNNFSLTCSLRSINNGAKIIGLKDSNIEQNTAYQQGTEIYVGNGGVFNDEIKWGKTKNYTHCLLFKSYFNTKDVKQSTVLSVFNKNKDSGIRVGVDTTGIFLGTGKDRFYATKSNDKSEFVTLQKSEYYLLIQTCCQQNVKQDVSLYINGTNHGTYEVLHPELDEILLTIGNEFDSAPISLVSYCLYNFCFNEADINLYMNFIQVAFPDISLQSS